MSISNKIYVTADKANMGGGGENNLKQLTRT